LLAEALRLTEGVPATNERIELLVSVASAFARLDIALGADEHQALERLLARAKLAAAEAPQRFGSIKLLYFYSASCATCRTVKPLIKKIQDLHLGAEIRQMDASGREAIVLHKALAMRVHLPERDHSIVPAVFSTAQAVVGPYITMDRLEALAESARGLPAPWELSAGDQQAAELALKLQFRKLTPLVVIVGGLVDGVNPCAFAVIIFFITYMSYLSKGRREIVLAGTLFTLAVFITYLAIGVALYEVMGQLQRWSDLLRKILTGVMAAFVLLLAALSFIDGLHCLRGRTDRVVLKLPDGLRKRIRLLVARRMRLNTLAFASIVLGAAVALLEFPCTGQLYAPIAFALHGLESERLTALKWLVVYNLCFIAPLVVVFLGVLFGTTNERISALFQRHMATTKLALAAVFLGLFAVLILLPW